MLALTACDERRSSLAETPYAARYAVSKPAYVRTASAAAKPAVVTEIFVDPQFTAAQAAAGAEVYKAVCARCHASTQWTGGTFAASWQDRRLSDFYDLVSVTMPQDNPGGLTTQQYVDATAHVLELAGFASGNVALRADTAMLRHARLTMKKKASPDTAVASCARARTEALMRTNVLPALALVLACATTLRAQASMPPTNDAPNPYRTVEGWAKLPEGRTWGSTSGVDVDVDGTSIWVAERCGTNSCAESSLPSILKFDATGALVQSFGGGLLLSPHGLTVDRDGNVWVTDCACTRATGTARTDSSAAPKGHQVFKFSPDGKLLMTLGKPGGGRDTAFFWQPNDVLVAPNGDIFVAEGHSSSAGSTARILKFRKDGTLIKTWGTLGSGPDQLNQPHALAMDSRGGCSSATAATIAS